MYNTEEIYENIYTNTTQEEKKKEIDRLCMLYYQRTAEFKKSRRIRWLLSFAGFALVFSYVLLFLAGGDIKSIFSEDIRNVLMLLLVGILVTGFYFFVNVSIFGWLFQKDIDDSRRLDELKKRITVLEKLLENKGGDAKLD